MEDAEFFEKGDKTQSPFYDSQSQNLSMIQPSIEDNQQLNNTTS